MIQECFELGRPGQAIRGTVYRPDTLRRCPCVLMLHGFTGHRFETGYLFVTLGRSLAQRGIAAVTFDFRGCGESDGRFEQALSTGHLDDCCKVAAWVKGRLFADRSRLALLGFSLGGLLASCVSARVDDFTAMVLLAPTTIDNLCRYANGPAQGRASVVVGPHQLHAGFFDDLRTLDPLSDITVRPRPTLIVQGTADTAVQPEVSAEYVSRLVDAGVPHMHTLIEGADHGFYKRTVRLELLTKVTEWLVQQLDA